MEMSVSDLLCWFAGFILAGLRIGSTNRNEINFWSHAWALQ
jgi:hypothetical protein